MVRGIVFGLLSGTVGRSGSSDIVGIMSSTRNSGLLLSIRSCNRNVSRRGVSGVFSPFFRIGRKDVSGVFNDNVKLGLTGCMMDLRRNGV